MREEEKSVKLNRLKITVHFSGYLALGTHLLNNIKRRTKKKKIHDSHFQFHAL